MSPVTREIDPVADWRSWLVIVPGAVDDTMGVSVLMVRPVTGRGYRPGW